MESLEEEIVIDEDDFSDSDEEAPPRARTRRNVEDGNDGTHLNPATDPLYRLEEQEKVPTTADIRHFFERTADGTVCRPCR